ncbi:hypothetical protein BKA81DRAFT_149776 [Phyllosticta paracitricarpa]
MDFFPLFFLFFLFFFFFFLPRLVLQHHLAMRSRERPAGQSLSQCIILGFFLFPSFFPLFQKSMGMRRLLFLFPIHTQTQSTCPF